MNLSTSSSKGEETISMNATTTDSSHGIFAKIFLVVVGGMGLAMLVLFLLNMTQDASKDTILARVSESQKALPQILKEPHELMMMYGSSMVRAGFSPRQFDKAMAEQGKDIKSFNFGFGGLNPYFQDILSRRLREAFQQEDRRLKLAVIEFNPFQASQTRWGRAQFTIDAFITMLGSDEELFEIAKQDLTRGIRLFTIKYLRAGISAEMITGYYGREIFPARRPPRLEEDQEIAKKRRELGRQLSEIFEKEYPDYNGEEWHYGWQGGGTIPEERAPETLDIFKQYYATMQTDERMKNFVQRRVLSADILELNFEPILVESFIGIVENFKQFSDKVEVVMLPRNTRWVNYTPDGQARLEKAIAQIENATGIKIRNHQDLDVINPDMFGDATHLQRYTGAVAYTDYLIEQYAADL